MTSQVTLSELISQWAETSRHSRGSLYRAAALKTTFDPLLLQPIDSGYIVSAQERENLLKDSNLLNPEIKSNLRVLDDDVRRLELRFYQDIEQLKADFIKANQDENSDDWTQRMFRAYVFGEAKPIEEQSKDELLGTITVLDWFRGIEIASELALPKLEDALTQVALNTTQELLKNIQGETFTNREKELEKLQAYIRSSSALPFTIRGVGGIGKSALVAASLSRELRKASSHQKPLVVWLDFTRNQVFDAADNPFLLLEIITSELIKQLPQNSIELESIRQLLEDDQKRGVLQDDVKLRIQQLAQVLQQANRLMVPFYLVMDTLEELQYKDWQTVQDLYEFTENLREYITHIKTFMIARLKIEKGTDKLDLDLKHLDARSACKLLENMNVPPKDAMRLTKGLSGGHPLSLKVAAQLFNKAQEEGRLNSAVGRLNLINEIIQAQGVEILLDRYIRPGLFHSKNSFERI